jgi:hypothetical protein
VATCSLYCVAITGYYRAGGKLICDASKIVFAEEIITSDASGSEKIGLLLNTKGNWNVNMAFPVRASVPGGGGGGGPLTALVLAQSAKGSTQVDFIGVEFLDPPSRILVKGSANAFAEFDSIKNKVNFVV